MSIRLKVNNDRITLDLECTSAHIEFPLSPPQADPETPLIPNFSPGLPVHIEQDTDEKVILYDGWLLVGGHVIMPIGPQGSVGDGITIVKRRSDSRAPDGDDAFSREGGFDVHDERERR